MTALSSVEDPELEVRCRKVCEKISEDLHIITNEPSLAMYRLQEHIRRTLPLMVEKKNEVNKLHSNLQGRYYDLENAVKAVDGILRSGPIFQRIHEMCRSAMFHKQQLDYERSRRADLRPSMYHLDSSDSLIQELRKSKSLGILGRASSPDVMSESGSAMSRSTASTPVSEYPDSSAAGGADLDTWIQRQSSILHVGTGQTEEDDKSSSTTSGADSESLDSPDSVEDKTIAEAIAAGEAAEGFHGKLQESRD